MRRDKALGIAEGLVERLRPACVRIEIAGSIRRGKGEVKDIETVAIPKPGIPRPEFGKKIYKTQLDKILFGLRQEGRLAFAKFGDRYKKFFYGGTSLGGIDVDLFLVLPPAQWGVQMVIRTGPAEFSQWCVTQRAKGGALPDDWCVRDGGVYPMAPSPLRLRRFPPNSENTNLGEDGLLLMPEEIYFLNFLGLGWIEPSRREARWKRSW